MRLAAPRALTQGIAAWIHYLHNGGRGLVDGVRFESRHGDGLGVGWAIFERDDDGDSSRRLSDITPSPLGADRAELVEAFRLHRLAWES